MQGISLPSWARDMATGAGVGLSFGLVECLFVAVLPQIFATPFERVALLTHLGLISLYASLGALMGLASGRVGPVHAKHRAGLGATLGFLAIHALHLGWRSDLSLRSIYSISLPLALALGAIVSPRRATSAPGPLFVFSLAAPWVLFCWVPDAARALRVVAGVLLPAAMWLAAAAIGTRLARSPRARAAAGLAAGIAILVSAERMQRHPPLRTPPPASQADARLPSVVVISLDTVRADRLSVYGYPRETSPLLARFAANATRYSRSASTSDMTLPSHASMFTGLYPLAHGAHFAPPHHPYGTRLSDEYTTLAEILSAAGYRTGGVTANPGYLGRGYNLSQGFQFWDDQRATPWVHTVPPYFVRAAIVEWLRGAFPQQLREAAFRHADAINRSVFTYLDEIAQPARRTPFLLFVNYMDAHWPYQPPARFHGIFEPHGSWLVTPAAYKILEREVSSLERSITEPERRDLSLRYDESIAYLDSEVGRLLDRLDQLGVFDDALVIVTSDHGEAFGERNLVEHAVSVHSDQVNVPLLIKYPRQTQARVDDRLASGVDILPTILDTIGLPIPSGLHGQSLAEPATARPVISESYPSGVQIRWHSRFDRIERSLILGSHKLIHSTRASSQLYDVMADPFERDDLAGSLPLLVQEREAALARWVSSISTGAPEPTNEVEEIDPELKANLKALGYAE